MNNYYKEMIESIEDDSTYPYSIEDYVDMQIELSEMKISYIKNNILTIEE